jgi:hypothetical protein
VFSNTTKLIGSDYSGIPVSYIPWLYICSMYPWTMHARPKLLQTTARSALLTDSLAVEFQMPTSIAKRILSMTSNNRHPYP